MGYSKGQFKRFFLKNMVFKFSIYSCALALIMHSAHGAALLKVQSKYDNNLAILEAETSLGLQELVESLKKDAFFEFLPGIEKTHGLAEISPEKKSIFPTYYELKKARILLAKFFKAEWVAESAFKISEINRVCTAAGCLPYFELKVNGPIHSYDSNSKNFDLKGLADSLELVVTAEPIVGAVAQSKMTVQLRFINRNYLSFLNHLKNLGGWKEPITENTVKLGFLLSARQGLDRYFLKGLQ